MSSVSLEGVVKRFYPNQFSLFSRKSASDSIVALNHIYLDIKTGETLGIIGPTGCGKTTLLKVIAGLEKVEEGAVYFDGRNVTKLRPRERGIGMVFQNYALYPHMVTRENLAFPFRLRKWPESMIDERVEFTAETLGVGFKELLGRMPRTLSHGQKQRVALGRCIIRKPNVFLLDEPLSNLDAKLRVKTRAEIKKILRKFSVTTVYVTHDQSEAIALAHRIAVMREGKLEQVGSFEEIYNHPNNLFVASFVGDPSMNFLPLTLSEKRGKLIMGEALYNIRMNVPSSWEGILKEKNMVGKDLIFGIRPEYIKLGRSIGSNGSFTFKAEVEEKEITINRVYLFLKIGHHSLVAAVENQDYLPSPGEKAEFTFPVSKGKIFNKENELALVN